MGQTRVLAISGSPRRHGNSEKLLDVFLEEFRSAVPQSYIEKIVLKSGNGVTQSRARRESGFCEDGHPISEERDLSTAEGGGQLDILPCLGCDYCVSGKCIQNDSMQQIYDKIRSADVIVLAAPVYFYGLPSHVKAMIDRCQLFFNMKYRRKEGWRSTLGTGVLICCGATKGDRLFTGISACAKYWFDAIDFRYAGKVLVRGVDRSGEITGHPEAFEETRSLSKKIASNFVQKRKC